MNDTLYQLTSEIVWDSMKKEMQNFEYIFYTLKSTALINKKPIILGRR